MVEALRAGGPMRVLPAKCGFGRLSPDLVWEQMQQILGRDHLSRPFPTIRPVWHSALAHRDATDLIWNAE